MRVSIVTPSFNQAQFLEQTILSVLNQSYENIEYIVIDGGSTDGSAEILHKYKDRFAYWHSKPDRGHWDAVCQGFQKATGDVLYFLNSDDLILEDTVTRIVEIFRSHPDAAVVYGKAKFIDAEGRYIHDYPSGELDITTIFQTWENPVPQPSAFLRRDVFEQLGGPNEAWPFCADFEYWIRVAEHRKFLYVPEYFSSMRIHSAAKTSRLENVQAQELIRLCQQTIQTERFKQSGVDPVRAEQGAYLRASRLYRRSGKKIDALRSYFAYCKRAFAWPTAFYRFSRYVAGIILDNNDKK